MQFSSPHIIVALDNMTQTQADDVLSRLVPDHCRVKIGNELFTRAGPRWVEQVVKRNFSVFLDLKFHDIPNTVHNACRAAVDLGVWMLNVHTLGGLRMLEAARQAIPITEQSPLLIGVTILTSADAEELHQVGLMQTPAQHAQQLALLAQQVELDGVVCSAQEAAVLRQRMGENFCLVTPGIRPLGSQKQDQRRTMTPKEAVAAGANYLVIGRPITQAADPSHALQTIFEGLS